MARLPGGFKRTGQLIVRAHADMYMREEDECACLLSELGENVKKEKFHSIRVVLPTPFSALDQKGLV